MVTPNQTAYTGRGRAVVQWCEGWWCAACEGCPWAWRGMGRRTAGEPHSQWCAATYINHGATASRGLSLLQRGDTICHFVTVTM